jgi:hypothetical protein
MPLRCSSVLSAIFVLIAVATSLRPVDAATLAGLAG